MRTALLMVLLAGCGDSTPATPDAGGSPDAGAGCLTAAQRSQACTVDVSGTSIDFVTGQAPNPGAPVLPYINVTTVLDATPAFSPQCGFLASFSSDPGATFSSSNVDCSSPDHPPTLLIAATNPPGVTALAKTAVLRPLTCSGADCGAVDVRIEIPTRAVNTNWRQTLDAQGMPDALSRGLVLFAFYEADGVTPAAGVSVFAVEGGGQRALTPGTEVRFLGSSRDTLSAKDQAVTGPSGLAVVALDSDQGEIAGSRGDTDMWLAQPVVFATGWIIQQEQTLSQ